MKGKMYKPYMEAARSFALLSYAQRKKVGAIAITPQDVMLYSWNGRVAGGENKCEIDDQDVTRPDVLHAEANIVSKAAREGISLKGSTIVVTLSPCLACAMQLYQAGIRSVIYEEEYRETSGIDFLRNYGVEILKYEDL